MDMRRAVRLRAAARTAIVAVVLGSGFIRASAQNEAAPDAEARFEVASIRAAGDLATVLANSGGRVPPMGVRTQPNGMTATMATVEMLLLDAYQLRNYQLIGGPAWMKSDRFDITARAAGEVTPAVARQLLKNLLRDRFSLRARPETREADVHSLVLARDDGRLGPGLKRTSPECEATLEARKKGAAPPSGPPNFDLIRKQTFCGMSMMSSTAAGASNYSMGGVPLQRLVNQISGEVGGPVVDRTSLTGMFDILLEYASQRRQAPVNLKAPDLTTDVAPPALRDALPEQLGLRLETGKGPLEVLVIDGLERPTDN
jgi:uncharacterized protein (TIGR03435 family)